MSERDDDRRHIDPPIAPRRPSRRAPSRDGAAGGEIAAEPRGARSMRMLRFLLPLGAVAVVFAIFSLSRPEFSSSGLPVADIAAIEAGFVVRNPSYAGRTAEGAPFLVSAAVARPDGPDPKSVTLEEVMGKTELEGGHDVVLEAPAGVYDRVGNALDLGGGVKLSGRGYTLSADTMAADIKAREARTESGVAIDGPAGLLTADRMRIVDDPDKGLIAFFEGSVAVTIVKVVESRATGE